MSNKRISKAAQLLREGFPEQSVTPEQTETKGKGDHVMPAEKVEKPTTIPSKIIGKPQRSKITLTVAPETVATFQKLQLHAIENGLKKPTVGEMVDAGAQKLLEAAKIM